MELNPILKSVEELENVGEQIVIARKDVVNIDRKRNKNREALSALLNDTEDEKVYFCLGNTFYKVSKETAKKMIRQDQEELNNKIQELREEMKVKVNELRKLEGRAELKGYDLSPMSRLEVEALKDVLPNVVI
ncbi:p53 and DNA damage-regulated protein 1-like protein [Leptotrombidium deliense]|uniref:p53 and DNA damage-regulated protein 1 n=1 Tax=Leptotrombidium deliense TaxID=299467 RepID=A0A443SAV6_9ACAR|nr:p53 and DNA damage-regulated protein 1-like protein [Leptotrombidium deliense]